MNFQDVVEHAENYRPDNFRGRKLHKRATAPCQSECSAEVDSSPLLDEDQANYYQSQIDVLHLIVELGSASQMAMPSFGWERFIGALATLRSNSTGG